MNKKENFHEKSYSWSNLTMKFSGLFKLKIKYSKTDSSIIFHRTTLSRRRSETISRSTSRSCSKKKLHDQIAFFNRRFSPCFAICSIYSFALLSRCSWISFSSSSWFNNKSSNRTFPLVVCSSFSSRSLSLGISSFSSIISFRFFDFLSL